jgi:hypothetical protein
MVVSGVLVVALLATCWLFCLADAVLTPAAAYRGLPKGAWIGIIAVTFAAGAIAWLAVRWSQRRRPWVTTPRGARMLTRPHDTGIWYLDWAPADGTIARHVAGRYRKITAARWGLPMGPDDDPEFLRELDRRIKGTSADNSDDR